MSCSSMKCRMSYIRRVVSPIYLPGMKHVWSLLIRIGRTDLIRSAIQLEASLFNRKNEIPYTGIPTLSEEIKDNLEGEITYVELTSSIKRMKNEKKSWIRWLY
jgi:hypothetical protein